MYAVGLTDIGKTREKNEDAIFVSTEPIGPLPNLFIVADGMGGHNAGEVASEKAVDVVVYNIKKYPLPDILLEEDYLDLLVSAIHDANRKICGVADVEQALSGMGTTFTACVIAGDKIYIAHVGDSRAYAVKSRTIKQLTNDHTYINEMVKAGELTKEEAEEHPNRHMLTRVLGMHNGFEVDGFIQPLGDTVAVLLCSDGLSNMLEDKQIRRIVNGEGLVEHRTQTLIDEANLHGGVDNISAVLIDVKR